MLPTLLDLLKITVPPGQLYEGRSLYTPETEDHRLVYLNSYEQYGVIARDHLVSSNRKSDEGGAASCPRTVYAISSQGSKTLFTEDHTAKAEPVSIRPFDEFQENFLCNYSFYCKSVCQPGQTVSLPPKP